MAQQNPWERNWTQGTIATIPEDPAIVTKRTNEAAASAYEDDLAAAELRLRRLQLQKGLQEIGEKGDEAAEQVEAKGAKDLRQRLRYGNILESIENAKMIARRGGTGYSSLTAAIPKTDARALEAALQPIKASLAFERLQEMRDESKTGGALGSVAVPELELLQGAVASLDTGVDQAEFIANLEKIKRHFVGSQMALSGIDPTSKEGEQVFGEYGVKPLKAPGAGGGNDPNDPNNYTVGFDETYATDYDKKFAALAQSAFDKGASAEEMNALARQYGYGMFNPAQLAEGIAGRREGRAVNITAPSTGLRDPSIMDRAIHNAAASPVGTFFGQAANALTFGTMDELGGIARGDSIGDAFGGRGVETNKINLQKALQAITNPKSAMVGNVTGGMVGAALTGGITGVGRAAATALAPRALAADALFGGAYGAGESNDSRLAGAATGALAGAAGGAVGRKAVDSLGTIVGGVGGPGKQLYERGVTLTPGQIGESSGGAWGARVKAKEDALEGFVGIGNDISNARRRGMEQWNQSVFKDALDIIGQRPGAIAEEGVDSARTAVSDAYGRALDGQGFVADQQFTKGIGGVLDEARALPAIGDETAYSLERSVAPFVGEGGEFAGRDMQKMTQELQRRASRLDKSQSSVGPDAADKLRQALDVITTTVERQSPEVLPQFQAANKAYRNVGIIEDAVGRAINSDGVFTPAQLGMAARQNAKRFGGKYASEARPFFETQRAAQQVLPSEVPNSGTASRIEAGEGMIGAAKALARSLRRPLYSEPALTSMNTIAFARPDIAEKIGRAIEEEARWGGLVGAPAGAYYSQ